MSTLVKYLQKMKFTSKMIVTILLTKKLICRETTQEVTMDLNDISQVLFCHNENYFIIIKGECG